MIRLLRLDARNAAVRVAALARIAIVAALMVTEELETSRAPHDLDLGEPVLIVFVVYSVLAAIHAFTARRDVPVTPFLVADTVVLSLLVYAEGGAVADARFMLFVPVVVAVLGGPRLTLAVAVLSVAGFVAASIAHPGLGNEVPGRTVIFNALDLSWRGGLAVMLSVVLTQRADRIRVLAESRRLLAAQALESEARARRELSYALHDDLMQELLCTQQDLKAARRGRPEYLDRAQDGLAGALQRLRREIFQLHPHVLETAGLNAALDAVADHHPLADGGRAQVLVAPQAAGAHDELLFSVGRELLRNAARHSGAGAVELSVRCEGERIALCCRDDGCGMAPERRGEALAGGHLGLAACTERVEALGGSLEVSSDPGRGTRVRVELPGAPRGDEALGTAAAAVARSASGAGPRASLPAHT